jgi:hypothetical protein
MADRVKKVAYVYVMLPNRAGQGASILEALRQAGVNLLAFHAFPAGGAKADLVAEDNAALRRVAKKNGWKLSSSKKAFIVQGDDRVGAAERHFARLAEAGINVVANSAIAAGQGRYGMILWVKPKDYTKAARILGAR